MPLPGFLDKLKHNPNRLFLTDSLGALMSAFFLGIIMASFESFFGMPRLILYALSLVACIYAMYSYWCHLRNHENWQPYLKAISIANFLYCLITIGFVFYFYHQLTIWGLTYFLLELMVLAVLIIVEIKALQVPNNQG